ncbi:MAG: ABC transporter substrate-binding protein, partial [Lachnospiraceae bacterium]|nr:ABC transporter substrate-binding protein [Lachnospiraceae bacterium]
MASTMAVPEKSRRGASAAIPGKRIWPAAVVKNRRLSSLLHMLVGVLVFTSIMAINTAATNMTMDEFDEIVSTYTVDDSIPDYKEYLAGYDEVYPDTEIVVTAEDLERYDESDETVDPVIYTDHEGLEGDSVYTSEDSLAEFSFTVEEEGFYNIVLDYFPVEGKGSSIERAFFIDGELPYEELALISFNRVWVYDVEAGDTDESGSATYDWGKDNQGNDNKPSMTEAPEWISSYVYDSDGYITSPLKVYLTEGEHTISLLSEREPMVISAITFCKAEETSSYEEVKAEQDAAGAEDTTGISITIEGENATKSSSQMLYPVQDQSSPSVSPSSAKELLNNTIGGNSWRLVGQWIEWDFDVPESGYYNISLYDAQNTVRGIYVSRRITIDGEVPFEELEAYGFTYSSSWREDVLSDEDGNAYSFYLEEGHHTIRMEVVLGDFSDIISEVQDCVTQLNSIYREIIKITGVSPDTYRDYQI